MNKAYFILFLFLALPFAIYFLRPDFVSDDPYAFLLLACQKNNAGGMQGLPFLLFSVLPCNFLLLKALLFCCAFVSGVFLIKLAILFNQKNGWRASYLIFLGPIFVLEFVKLENDEIAYPFLFAALYFFFKSLKSVGKGRRYLALSLFLIVFAGLLWEGAIFYLIAFSFMLWPLVAITAPIVFLFRDRLFGAIIRNQAIQENLMFQFHYLFLLLFGFVGLFAEADIALLGIFFFALGALASKFWILAVPFFVVGTIIGIEKVNDLLHYRFDLQTAFVLIAVCSLIGTTQSVWFNPPQPNHWQAIDFALKEGNGKINNDFGLGYWVLWAGGETDSFQSPYLQKPFVIGSGVIVTEFPVGDCNMLKDFNNVFVYNC